MVELLFILAIPGAAIWVLGGLVFLAGFLAEIHPILAVIWVPCWIYLSAKGIMTLTDEAIKHDLKKK